MTPSKVEYGTIDDVTYTRYPIPILGAISEALNEAMGKIWYQAEYWITTHDGERVKASVSTRRPFQPFSIEQQVELHYEIVHRKFPLVSRLIFPSLRGLIREEQRLSSIVMGGRTQYVCSYPL